MSIVAGIDNDCDAANTYRLNFSEAHFFEKDICEMSTAELGAILPPGETLFAGCAPCQPFSRQNREKKTEDSRRRLLGEFQRFVVDLKPTHVVVENVPGLQRLGRDGPLAAFVQTLEEMGYRVVSGILHASHFGVPQRRTRFVLVASLIHERAKLPKSTHGPGKKPVSTVRDWMANLSPLEAGGVDPMDPDHCSMSVSATNMRRLKATPEGGGRESWSADLLLACHSDHKGHTDVYGRLAWDRPAAAMTTRCLSYSNGRFGHPVEDRAISVREAACLQTFPRDFRFTGNITSRGRQVGNAVPPLLSEAIGKVFGLSSNASAETLF